MPITIEGILVMVFAILPGLLGNILFEHLTDSNIKESQTDKILRIVLFSVFGMMLYVLFFVTIFKFTLPIYLFPGTFQKVSFSSIELNSIAFSLLVNFLCSLGIGFLCAKVFGKNREDNISNTWKIFSKSYLDNRWVVIALKNGDKYAGIVERCDPAFDSDERDILLTEPALFDKDQGNYFSLNYQYIYFSGWLVDSLAVVYDPDIDERATSPETFIFPKTNDDQRKGIIWKLKKMIKMVIK